MLSKRIDFPLRSLIKHAVPYWLYTLLFFVTAAAIVFLYLRQHELNRTQYLLNYYQSVYQQTGPTGLQPSFSASGADGGSFLRLEGRSLQLILVSNTGQTAENNLPDFTSFSATKSHIWHGLQKGKRWGVWTIAARKLADGNILQVGINSARSLQLLAGLTRSLFLAMLVFLGLSCIPAVMTARKNNSIIRQLTARITRLNEEKTDDIQAEAPAGPEEQELIRAIKKLLSRHQQLTRELRESMDNVAHDLRTPMTRLRTIAEYGLQKKEDPRHLRAALADCLEESDKLLAMLNAMLNVAEAEADTVQLNLVPTDLQETINEVLDLYLVIAEEKNVTINFTPEPGIHILADRRRISQVWANLVDNAIKYNATEISITTKRTGQTAIITIIDNGMGISPNEITKIWDRLYRGDRSRSKPGLGLGLTLVRATIANHNGTIKVRSTLNKETVFTISLPCVAPVE